MAPAAAAGAYRSTDVPTGRLGVWWFMGSEIVVFGGLISCYLLLRWRHPEWGPEADHTLNAAGAFNTLVLLTSSLTMVLAHRAVQEGRLALASRRLGLTLLGGLIFLSVKVYEYSHEIAGGFLPARSLFWSFYYAMTGLHALHVAGGMVAIAVIALGLRRGSSPERVEYVGIYWHFVDIVWIFLFPLLYLAH
jgi:heme/copper-type cytochrome/quinol oxidase subunit 3